MEIEPEVIPPQGQRQGPRPPRPGGWQSVLAGILGLIVLVGIAWVAFWLVLIILGVGLIGWIISKISSFITGKPSSSSNVQIVVRRSRDD